MRNTTKEVTQRFFSNIPKIVFVFSLILLCTTVLIFSMKKTITVAIGNDIIEITTLKGTLGETLEKNGITIGKKDKVSMNLDTPVEDGQSIKITKAVNVKLKADGQEKEILTAENNIGDMLSTEGITMNELDKITPALDTKIQDGLQVDIVRVTEKVVDEVHPVDYATDYTKSNEIEEGVEKVLQEGKKGERLVSTKIVYEDGKEVSKQVIKDEVTKEPVKQLVAQGTLGVYRPSRGGGRDAGTSFNYSKVLDLTATAYTASCSGVYGALTATGTVPKRDANGYSTIAVDPSVIPLGSKVYIEGYGYAIAEDTGGAIKGNKIDIFVNDHSEAVNWGVRSVKLYVLK